MARAKQTGRSEARRRFRQAATEPVDDAAELDYGERKSDIGAGKERPEPAAGQRTASTRPGFATAFRAAYHPPRFREDVRHLPMLLRSRAFLAALAMIVVGAVAVYLFPNYTGSAFAFELLIWPGSALAPQLVAGFFAPRASYILGFIVGVIQGIVFTIFLTQFSSRLGTTLPPQEVTNLFTVAFLTGPVTGGLFAAAAAWYRRFLALSSPRRTPAGRSSAKANPSRRTTGR